LDNEDLIKKSAFEINPARNITNPT